jgi:hypothetical protein
MLWSQFFSIVCLLATSVSAIPTKTKTPVAATPTPSLAVVACTGSSCESCAPIVANDPLKDLAHQQKPFPDTKKTTNPKKPADVKNTTPLAKPLDAKNPTSPKPGVSTRMIKDGWFNQEECSIIQREAEDGVNFLHLIDTLTVLHNSILGKYGYRWAVAGGLALKIHGMEQRYTADIDIVVQTSMKALRAALAADDRFLLPGNWWPANGPHLRVFFKYGAWAKKARPLYVEIDLIIAGIHSNNMWFQ